MGFVCWQFDLCQSGWRVMLVRVEKPLQWAIVFKYFRQFKEKQWPSTFVIFAPESFSTQRHVTRLIATLLNHWGIDSYRFDEKNGVWLVVSRNLRPVFCVQDGRSRIAQVKYQEQARYTRILDRKLLIDTSFHIRHRLELKYFHFSNFLLNAHRAAHQTWKSENWELQI